MAIKAKKQAYKRKDCGDTNTSALTEKKKKRAYRRNDCIIGTDTPAVMEKKKSAYRRKKCLPHDLIVEEILTRLPVTSLLKSVRVSKLWYNSIHNDHKHLTYSHFLQSQKQPQVIFSLLNVRSGFQPNTDDTSYACHFFKFTAGNYSYDHVLRFDKFRNALTHPHMWELVGYCNGLPCMAEVGHYSTRYMILDPNRDDFLYIFYPASVGICTPNAHIICHGFGFDPSANEYKLASIFRTAENELNFVVFTLGTKSWRNITAVTTPMSAHGGRPIIKLRSPTGSDKSAIFCATSSSRSSGCLVWKIIATLGGAGTNHIQHDVNNEMEMLLLFNLHDEKFQFIQLPAKSTTDEQKKNLLVDYPHLLEFKGSPCIARIEKLPGNISDYPHRCRDDHQGSSNCCCCCCKVHLYVLKDKVEQAWVKEESFDVCVNSTPRFLRELGTLAPDPCCFCFGSTTTPPTRIFSFSD
ncbi:putative F-box protein At1g33530 [Papaver somniferum]|uniref:putative F-box protein At1g33530 n=1 Tax=Papaver somniferum TaxID=3469 RepID=UPI000E702A82|nr:putative F-box protein At1g33530 [Papaver somniferum]